MCYGMKCRFEDWRGECDAMINIKSDEIEAFAHERKMSICELAEYLDYLESASVGTDHPVLVAFKEMMAKESPHYIWARLYKDGGKSNG